MLGENAVLRVAKLVIKGEEVTIGALRGGLDRRGHVCGRLRDAQRAPLLLDELLHLTQLLSSPEFAAAAAARIDDDKPRRRVQAGVVRVPCNTLGAPSEQIVEGSRELGDRAEHEEALPPEPRRARVGLGRDGHAMVLVRERRCMLSQETVGSGKRGRNPTIPRERPARAQEAPGWGDGWARGGSPGG